MVSLEVQHSTRGLTCGLADQLLDGSDVAVPRLCLSPIWHELGTGGRVSWELRRTGSTSETRR